MRKLLSGGKPPSIGIACFNIQQRDLIMDELDDAGASDAEFGKRLAEARQRQGENSFEGLFVKNLENVQGDERDCIIISTTYGPDAKGKFYRRFGPLGQAGGGRRLNVLVTRARQQVHLVTSIPPALYRSLPPIPPGQSPSGGWLLFAYLKFAEDVAASYHEKPQPSADTKTTAPTPHASAFAAALASILARNTSSQPTSIGATRHSTSTWPCATRSRPSA